MKISNDFREMIDSCSDDMTVNELFFLAGYAKGILSDSYSSNLEKDAARRFLKTIKSTYKYSKDFDFDFFQDTTNIETESLLLREDYHIEISEFHSQYKVGNTQALIYDAILNITERNRLVVYVTDRHSVYIKDMFDVICLKMNTQFCVMDTYALKILSITDSDNLVEKINRTIGLFSCDSKQVVVYIDADGISIPKSYINKLSDELDSEKVSQVNILRSYSVIPSSVDIMSIYSSKKSDNVYKLIKYTISSDKLYFSNMKKK